MSCNQYVCCWTSLNISSIEPWAWTSACRPCAAPSHRKSIATSSAPDINGRTTKGSLWRKHTWTSKKCLLGLIPFFQLDPVNERLYRQRRLWILMTIFSANTWEKQPWLQLLSKSCQHTILLNFCPWDVLCTWWRGLRWAPCPWCRVRWWYASSVVRSSDIKPLDIRYDAVVQGKSVCQNPNSEWMQQFKQQKNSQPLTVFHLEFRCSGIADLPRDRQSGEPQCSQKELRNYQPIKANAKLCHIVHEAVVQPSEMHSNTWDFDNKKGSFQADENTSFVQSLNSLPRPTSLYV